MKDSFSWITPKQAAELVGYTARHIQNLITTGKLSAHKEDGKYYIDKSEFFRVFPKAHRLEVEGNSSQRELERQRLQMENELLKETSLRREKEIEFLRNQIESVGIEKSKMLEAIVNQTRMLEHEKKPKLIDQYAKKGWKDLFKRSNDRNM